jgi:hypothetical protein
MKQTTALPAALLAVLLHHGGECFHHDRLIGGGMGDRVLGLARSLLVTCFKGFVTLPERSWTGGASSAERGAANACCAGLCALPRGA